MEPTKPATCDECGAAMEHVTVPGATEETGAAVRLICPRCNHEQQP